MNRFICRAFAFALLVASPSFAADMPGGRYQEPVEAPAYNWGGAYVGINGGYGWGSSDWSGSFASGTADSGGGLVGGTIGFNMQGGPFVFGLEGDAAGSWIRSSTSTGTGFCSSPGCQIQTSWFATARGRIGYAFDRALPYLTAGGAFGDVQMLTNGADRNLKSGRLDRRPGRRIRNSRTLDGEGRIPLCQSWRRHLWRRGLRSEHDSKLQGQHHPVRREL